jgi:sigma-B regulation protein RsbU (phosphoserine phosphatase)
VKIPETNWRVRLTLPVVFTGLICVALLVAVLRLYTFSGLLFVGAAVTGALVARRRLALVFAEFVGATAIYSLIPSGGLSTFAFICAMVSGSVLAFQGIRWTLRKSIWRLRNRLVVTYVFIAVVPIVLIVALALMSGYILAGQTASYLMASELDRTIDLLGIPARALSYNRSAPLVDVLDRVAPFLRQRFPQFEVAVSRDGKAYRYPSTSDLQPVEADIPNYSGLTIRNGRYSVWSHEKRDGLIVDTVAPIERETLRELFPHLGKVDLRNLISGQQPTLVSRHRLTPEELRAGQIGDVPPPANQVDFQVEWFSPVSVAKFGSADKLDSFYLLITTRPSALIGALFGERFKVAQALLFVLLGIAILFLVVEIVSLFIGISLTRTITGAIQALYDGTRRVAEGDFSHRIVVRGKDQLAAVSESFNGMTARLEELLQVEKEKERLQSELEIAREVQTQLFPRSSPKMRTLDVSGICRPARMVSGDYYDYLCLQETNMAMAIGDVAGKGISAALLMASIQSIMRTQLSSVSPVLAAAAGGGSRHVYSTSHMVSQLNRQLYAHTSPEKYATFLFGVYDEYERTLTYTNAGHLPPILLRDGEAKLLEVTGTVVGAFPLSRYEEQTLKLEPGDLLVSYTDGITEPENEYGEEFGIDRVVELLVKHQKLEPQEIMTRVMDTVRNWTSAPELPDDMTLVLARRTA